MMIEKKCSIILLSETIYMVSVLFFVMSISILITNTHACSPYGHIKIRNNTKIPISVTTCRQKMKKTHCKKDNKKTCHKKLEWRIKKLNIKPHSTSETICWSEKNMKLVDLKTSFMRNNVREDGPHIFVENYKRILSWLSGEVQNGGSQNYLRSRGCEIKNNVCAVTITRKPKW